MRAYSTVVIGYGNTLRGDDAIGPWVAGALAARHLPDVLALAVAQLTPELAEQLAQARTAFFIDAQVDAFCAIEQTRLYAAETNSHGTHQCSPRQLLELAQLLYGQAPEAWMLRVSGEDFGLRESLSPGGLRNAEQALALLEQWVRR
jgi:hydrogenase maturation protease